MLRYAVSRALALPVVLLVLVTLSFFLVRLAPGDPFASEQRRPKEIQDQLREKYGLDGPLWRQYLTYLGNLATGDLGLSTKYKDRTVTQIVLEHLPESMVLGATSMAIALAVGLTTGIIAAIRQNTHIDHGMMAVSMVGISLPTFVVGPLLVLTVAMWWKLLPTSGWTQDTTLWHGPALVAAIAAGVVLALAQPARVLRVPLLVLALCVPIYGLAGGIHVVLPAATLALPFLARISRLARTGMLEIIRQEFIKTAHAKGLPEHIVVTRHALKGAMLPVISYLGPASADILVGSLVVEKVFSVPGIGSEFVNSAVNRDYGLVLGLVLVYGALLVLFNLAVDLAYGVLDPRISYE